MRKTGMIKFEFARYQYEPLVFENELVAELPGLLITQFELDEEVVSDDRIATRFDYFDDWYSILVFFDKNKNPTGHYLISIQSPLKHEKNLWRGYDLILSIEILPGFNYTMIGEENFISAVESGWMRVYAAANAREAARKLSLMLEKRKLPPEVMDAVGG